MCSSSGGFSEAMIYDIHSELVLHSSKFVVGLAGDSQEFNYQPSALTLNESREVRGQTKTTMAMATTCQHSFESKLLLFAAGKKVQSTFQLKNIAIAG